jgi:small-conductance mechanosensitive channel
VSAAAVDSAVAADSLAPGLDAGEAVEEATTTLRDLGASVLQLLPKIGIAIAVLLLAGLLAAGSKALLRRALGSWERANAFSALASVAIWLVALGAALSVIAGDARALVGSVGLFGLALSWALQAPIESFTGWLLNSFRGYYRVGDRIEVGEVFGDVARIDFLTTTVWEAGGPEKAVQAAQPTGALVTFPNSEVLRSNLVNYTRDFPYVWDEVTVGVANESDLPYTVRVFEEIAQRLLGDEMAEPAARYRALLDRARLGYEIAAEPQVYVSPTDAFTNVTIRYLVPARQRRAWASRLVLALAGESARAEHHGRILAGYPRTQVDLATATADDSRLAT